MPRIMLSSQTLSEILEGRLGLLAGLALVLVGIVSFLFFTQMLIPKFRQQSSPENAKLFTCIAWFEGLLFTGGGVIILLFHYRILQLRSL